MGSPPNHCILLPLFFLLGAWAHQAASRTLDRDDLMHLRHKQWMANHRRVYKDAGEKQRRFEIFRENVRRIETFNRANDKPYKLNINRFADITNEEFKATRNGFDKKHMASVEVVSPFKYENVTAVPASVDWRNKSAVTPIKNQLKCGK